MRIEGVILEARLENIHCAEHIVTVLEYADGTQHRYAFPIALCDVGGDLCALVGQTVTLEFEP